MENRNFESDFEFEDKNLRRMKPFASQFEDEQRNINRPKGHKNL